MTSSKEIISETLARKMMGCIKEYEAIKGKRSTTFKTVAEFCAYHQFSHQNFMKIYHRYQNAPSPEALLPQKRGPKFGRRRFDAQVEELVVKYRQLGNNRYEISDMLKQELDSFPSPSTVYNILRRKKLHRLRTAEKAERRRIITKKSGELAHIDLHRLPPGITITNPNQAYYLLGMIDDFSRIVWLEVLESKKSLAVMFATLKAFNILKKQFGIEIDAVMTDNGAEFGSGQKAQNQDTHPFEALLKHMQMEHRYTRPYRPQTNGKIERFWRTLKEDFIEDAQYDDLADLKNQLLGFIAYYNEYRPHSALQGKTPVAFLQTESQRKYVTN